MEGLIAAKFALAEIEGLGQCTTAAEVFEAARERLNEMIVAGMDGQPTERARLRSALEFYRDPFAWKKANDPNDTVRIPDFYSETSFGDTAEAALAETN